MNLANVTAAIRPRHSWEAVDLGLALTRKNFPSILKGWCQVVLPLALVICAALFQRPGWAVFVLWWCKPLFEPVVLHDLSRQLFGGVPTFKSRWGAFGQGLKHRGLILAYGGLILTAGWNLDDPDDLGALFFFTLLLLPLRSLSDRALTYPVFGLEGLTGKRRPERNKVLSRNAGGVASPLCFISWMAEILLFLALWYAAELFIPGMSEEIGQSIWDWDNTFASLFDGDLASYAPGYAVLFLTLYFCALSFMTLFFVGGGFGLYVNTRSWTEGWDVELTFKKLGERLLKNRSRSKSSSGGQAALLFLLGWLFLAPPGHAQESASKSEQEVAAEVLGRPEFERKIVKSKEWVSDKKEKEEKEEQKERTPLSLSWLPSFLQALSWLIVIVAVMGLLFWLAKYFELISVGSYKSIEEALPNVTAVAGLDVRPESLPDDIVGTGKAWWQAGRQRDALALLYRGAIAQLVTRKLAPIEESDTELGCLQRVQNADSAKRFVSPFENLTSTWTRAAYGKQLPDDAGFLQLCTQWIFDQKVPTVEGGTK